MVERVLMLRCEADTMLGILHEPSAPAASVGVVIVVGGPQYRAGSHRQFVLQARALAQAGYAVLRFDYRGMGDSGGSVRAFEDVDADLRVAVDALMAEQPHLSGAVIWGLCDAASAALLYCASDPRLKGLVLVNPWARTPSGEARAYLRHYYARRFLQPSFWRKVLSGGFNPLRSGRELLGSVATAQAVQRSGPSYIERMRLGMQSFARPVLLLLSEHDLTAREFTDLSAADARWAQAMAARTLSTKPLAGADHTFSRREHLEQATQLCREWLAQFAADGR
jgi:exosortase A-associated hydrolase 1